MQNAAAALCRRPFLWTLLVSLLSWRAAAQGGEVTILRDEFGVPHIFGSNEEDVCFAMGYAQAQDRLEELLTQYRRAAGTMSEVFGPEYFRHDYRQRLWRHAAMARSKYEELSAKGRALIEAYQQGVKKFIGEHPDRVPEWAPEIEPWMCVALSRYIIWGWPEGDAGGDMLRAGIEPDPIEYHGSNQWLMAPERSAYDVPIALIDPHLSWYGQFRFYEARLYGGEIAFSGMAILGMPLPSLGHSRFCSIAMTSGGPDAADCYEEELHPDNPRQYRYNGQWRDMTVVREIIRVKDGDVVEEQAVEIEYTHHGPVAARKEGKAYTLKLPYFDQVLLADQVWRMITARNLNEMKDALGMLQLMEQNVMIATVDGDIYYLRNGRVPVRAPGYDYKRPLPGHTPQTEWRGLHPLRDLVQLHNPPQGYMQNCNVSPQFMLKGSPLTADRWADRPYLFNGYHTIADRADNPLHQRAAMCLELLHNNDRMTVDDAVAVAMSPDVYGADVWQRLLNDAWSAADEQTRQNPDLSRLHGVISGWDRRCDPTSVGAIAYRYWKDAFGPHVHLADRAGFPPPPSVGSDEILTALQSAAETMKAEIGRFDVPFGDVYRVGRRDGDETWPVGGGSVRSIATPRAISFDPLDADKTQFIGRGGQTSTQIVLLTRPPQSWTVVPLGQSDDPGSPHFDDQAEKLFSRAKMKPTYFLDRDHLDKHVVSTTVLTGPGE